MKSFLKIRYYKSFKSCTRCHYLTTLCLNISNISIITFKNIDHSCIMYDITKSKTFHLLENSVLEDCAYITNIALISSQFLFIYFFCLLYINWMIVWTPIKSLNINSNEKSRNVKISS